MEMSTQHENSYCENRVEFKDIAINTIEQRPLEPAINLLMIYTAYKLYQQLSLSCNHEADFLLGRNRKQVWQDVAMKIYNASVLNGIINNEVNISINQLRKKLNKFKILKVKSIKNKFSNVIKFSDAECIDNAATHQSRLLEFVEIIYYNIVCDSEFRKKLHLLCDAPFDANIIHLNGPAEQARITQCHMRWPTIFCIKCNKPLRVCFKKGQQDARGSLAMVYHNRYSPKLCSNYQKKCDKCSITYNYNRIDYTESEETLILAPSDFPYFTMGVASHNFIHNSVFKSIRNHQYSSKPSSIEAFVEHYNEDRVDEYDQIQKVAHKQGVMINVELSYTTMLRYFYLHSALRRLCDVKDFGTINVNGREVKVALKLSRADKLQMQYEDNILSECKSTKNIQSTKATYRNNLALLRFIVRKYGKELMSSEMTEFKRVPVKLTEKDAIQIYPGWFVMYGDGGEKVFRPRCAYPAICSKLDHMEETKETINEIGDDEDIDLKLNDSVAVYSAQRYYECDNSPCCNAIGNQKKSYKVCKSHVYKLNEKYEIPLTHITDFIKWYRIHLQLASIQKCNPLESISRIYSVDEELLSKLTTRQKKRKQSLIQALGTIDKEKRCIFKGYINKIYEKINNIRKKDRNYRIAAQKAKPLVSKGAISDNNQECMEQIIDILGDDVGDIAADYFCIVTSAQDLLRLETANNNYLEKNRGCRKAKNITPASTCTTKGLNVWMNCAGLLINLREEVVRETPTGVILDVADILTKNPTMKKYSQYIEAIGYDMMCGIIARLRNIMPRLSSEAAALWESLVLRAFIDIWHIKGHVHELCKEKGPFHPRSKKFKHILWIIVGDVVERINDIVAEQFWAAMNDSTQIKAMAKETIFIFLLEKRSHYNQKKLSEIRQNGWTMIPIEWFQPLRTIESGNDRSYKVLSADDLKGNTEQLESVKIKPDKLQAAIDAIKKETSAIKTIQLIPQKRSHEATTSNPEEECLEKKRRIS